MEIIDLEMIPGGPKKICHASQYDDGRVIRFNLKENGQPFALSGTETVQAIIGKPDGSETTLDIANTSSTYVDLITEADTCDIAGVNHCEMIISNSGQTIGTANFDMKVEEDAYGGEDITTGEASGKIASFETNIKDDLIECVCEINPEQNLHGYDHPWPAGGGKNLFDKSTINDGFWIRPDGTTDYSPERMYSDLIRIKPNTQYYITNTIGGNDFFSTIHYDSELNIIGAKNVGGSGDVAGTITSYNNSAYMRINSFLADLDILMVSEGSTATAYEPYENICPISGFTEMDIIRSGVNIWDEESENGYIYNGRYYPSDDYKRSKNFIPVKAGESYRVTGCTTDGQFACFDINQQYTGSIPFNLSMIYTIPEGTAFVKFYNKKQSFESGISINYPSTDTDYHPAEIIKKTVQFGRTVYGGELDAPKGKLKDTHGLITKDDCTTLTTWTNAGGLHIIRIFKNVAANRAGICSMLEQKTVNEAWVSTTECFSFEEGGEEIRIYTTSSTLADFLSRFNDLQLVYPLATPETIQLTPEEIETLLGQQNNVYHTANGETAVKFYIRT